MWEIIKELFSEFNVSSTIIVVIIVVVACVAHIDQLFIIKSWICGLFANVFVWAKKGQMSNKVRGTILKSVKNQCIIDNEILPNDLKIEWVNDDKKDVFTKNNQVIIRVKQSSNPHENLVTAVSEYVNEGLLHNVRRYLNKDVIETSKILMTKRIVAEAGRTSLTFLDENYIIPKLEADEELKDLYETLTKIDNNGMFVDVMLNEFKNAAMLIYGNIPDPELMAESKEFMRYLYDIAVGISDDVEKLCFNRDYFKVAIFLTASNNTLRRAGIQPFVDAVRKNLDNGIETIYIFGLGSKRKVAQSISEAIGDDIRLKTNRKHQYTHIGIDGRRIKGVFYECSIYNNGSLSTEEVDN